jgi:hypothetical protein
MPFTNCEAACVNSGGGRETLREREERVGVVSEEAERFVAAAAPQHGSKTKSTGRQWVCSASFTVCEWVKMWVQ